MTASTSAASGTLQDLDSNPLIASLARTMSEGLIVQDREGRIVACNPAAERILGLSADQIAGRTSIDPRWRAIREDGSGFPGEEHPISVSLRTGEPVVGVVMGIHQPDGRLVWIQANSQAIRAVEGRIQGALMTFSDVTAIKSSEITLREAESRLRVALDAADQGVWDWDLAMDEIRFSERALALIGLPGGQLYRRLSDWRHRIHPDDVTRLDHELRAHWRSQGGFFRTEFRVLSADGERWRYVVSRGSVLLRSPEGRPLRMTGTLADVTPIREALAAAAESEERFAHLAETVAVPIWMSDENDRHHYFNAAWRKLTGQAPPEAGQAAGDPWLEAIHEDDRAEARAGFVRASAGGAPFTLEYRLRSHDGSFRHVVEHASPRRDGEGRRVGYIGLCLDIEGRHRAELEVAMLSRALDQAALSVVITDENGLIEYANPYCCRLYGYRQEELLGRKPSVFKSDKTPPEVYRDLWTTILSDREWSGTMRNRLRDGREIWESISISPVRDGPGKTTHFVALKENITEKVAAQDFELDMNRRMHALDRLQAMHTLVGGVAHDFNNILVGILGFSELGEALLRQGSPALRVAGFFGEIRSAGERARTLIQQLLAAGRAGPISLAQISLDAIAEEVQAILAATMPNHVIHIDAALDLPEIQGDSGQIHQALQNLLINARDAMPNGGVITVEVALDPVETDLHCMACQEPFFGPHLRVSVRDRGTGIPPEILKRVLEPFFTTKEVGRGTGLGLPVVDGIVHRHGGHMAFASPPDGGAEFILYFPCPTANPAATAS